MSGVAEVTSNPVSVGYKQTEVGGIPEDWEVKKIGDLADVIRGASPRPKGDKRYYGGIVPRLMVEDVTRDGKYVTPVVDSLTEAGAKLSRPCPAGTLTIVCSGTVGIPSILAVDACIHDGFLGLNKISKKVSVDYLFHFFTTQREKFNNSATHGGVFTNLTTDGVREFLVAIPNSKKEQTAIANALSDVDALVSELEKLIAKKQAIKTATMQQLLTGRTRLPQFALREDGTPKGTKPSELGEIPEDWKVKTYGEVFTFLSTSTNSRADLSEDGDFGYVHYGDIHTEWNNKLDLNKERLPRISKNIVSSTFVMDGDLIMADASEDYEGIGKTVEVFNVGDKQLVAGLHTFLLRDKEKVLADGFRGYLHSIPAVKSSFDRLATGMKVYGISKNNLSSVCIPVPSLEEQTAIATILSDMDEEIQALEQRLGKTRQIKQGMMQELLTGKTRLIKPSKEVIHE